MWGHVTPQQVGGGLGVAVVGSLLNTRYQDQMTAALSGYHLPAGQSEKLLATKVLRRERP